MASRVRMVFSEWWCDFQHGMAFRGNGIKSFRISGPDTINLEVLLLQIPGSLVCNYADLVSHNTRP